MWDRANNYHQETGIGRAIDPEWYSNIREHIVEALPFDAEIRMRAIPGIAYVVGGILQQEWPSSKVEEQLETEAAKNIGVFVAGLCNEGKLDPDKALSPISMPVEKKLEIEDYTSKSAKIPGSGKPFKFGIYARARDILKNSQGLPLVRGEKRIVNKELGTRLAIKLKQTPESEEQKVPLAQVIVPWGTDLRGIKAIRTNDLSSVEFGPVYIVRS